jgi:hypothetical protein
VRVEGVPPRTVSGGGVAFDGLSLSSTRAAVRPFADWPPTLHGSGEKGEVPLRFSLLAQVPVTSAVLRRQECPKGDIHARLG